jgi:non-heme chloroperoxidase
MIRKQADNTLPQIAQINTGEQLRCSSVIFYYQKQISVLICINLCHLWQKNRTLIFLLLVFSLGILLTACSKNESGLKSVTVNGVQLHYQIEGKGEPIILIHGSLADYRYWKEQTSVLSKYFQMITYSRRYNYPNNNEMEPNHSAIVEAKDLLGLMDELKIEKAYIIGHSYGAYTALLFSIEHPERVKKLILAEPPLFRWLPEIPGGVGKMEEFLEETWIPIGKAYAEQGDKGGLEFTSQWYFKAPLDSISEDWRTYMSQNSKEWHALTISSDAFPKIEYSKIEKLNVPTLILSGGKNAGSSNDLIDGQLSRLLPNNKRVIIENAGHEMFLDNVNGSNQAILDFLKK